MLFEFELRGESASGLITIENASYPVFSVF